MRTLQRENTGVVLIDGIGEFSKPAYSMALRTVGRYTLNRKLVLVVIGVAIVATTIF